MEGKSKTTFADGKDYPMEMSASKMTAEDFGRQDGEAFTIALFYGKDLESKEKRVFQMVLQGSYPSGDEVYGTFTPEGKRHTSSDTQFSILTNKQSGEVEYTAIYKKFKELSFTIKEAAKDETTGKKMYTVTFVMKPLDTDVVIEGRWTGRITSGTIANL